MAKRKYKTFKKEETFVGDTFTLVKPTNREGYHNFMVNHARKIEKKMNVELIGVSAGRKTGTIRDKFAIYVKPDEIHRKRKLNRGELKEIENLIEG